MGSMSDYTNLPLGPTEILCLAFLLFGIGCYALGRVGL
jgi:hypothetical protein